MQSRNRDTDIENKHTDTKVGKARGWMKWGIENDIYTFYSVRYRLRDFPGGSDGKASVYNAGDPGLIPGLGRFPWRRKWQSTPVLLPGKSHGQRSPVGYSPWGCKESDTTEQLHFHFSVLSCDLNGKKIQKRGYIYT